MLSHLLLYLPNLNLKDSWFYDWQQLIGSALGAALPLLIWFFTEWYRKYKDHRKDIFNLEMQIVISINNLLECEDSLQKFLNDKVAKVIADTDSLKGTGQYCAIKAYLPNFYTHCLDPNTLNLDLRSGYLINKFLRIYAISQDYKLLIDDVRQQFKDTIEYQKEMVLSKANSPDAQNDMFKKNLEEFSKFVNIEVLEHNINLYFKLLSTLLTATQRMSKIGLLKWKLKFDPHFKFFINRKNLQKYRNDSFERMDLLFSEGVEEKVATMRANYYQTNTK